MRNETGTVKVKVGEGETAKEFSQDYQKVIFETSDDLLNLMQTKEGLDGLLLNYNYAIDLKERGKIRVAILEKQAGPEKAFEKSVKDFMKLRDAVGKSVTEAQARKIVTLMQDSEAA